MMNSNVTSKIVVGIGLAAAFGIGVSIFAVDARREQQSQFALNSPASATADPASQNAGGATAPAQSAATQMPTDQTPASWSAPPADQPAIASAAPQTSNVAKGEAGAPVSEVPKTAKLKKSDLAARRVADTGNFIDISAARVASSGSPGTNLSGGSASGNPDALTSPKELAPAPASSDTASATTASTAADAPQAPAQTGQTAATSASPAAPSNEPAVSDSLITASVKSEIATAAPNGHVDVTTANGVVVLAGSVPSHDEIVQAQEAAQRVAGVKYVDSSALVVSNQ
jgi:hypothetical protein